jgi:hypothetical protein
MAIKFEHRGDRRLHLKKPAMAFTSGGQVEIMNVSMAGIGVAHDFEVKVGQGMFLEFSMNNAMMKLWVTVASSRPVAGKKYRYESGFVVRPGSESYEDFKKVVKAGLDKLRSIEANLPPSV